MTESLSGRSPVNRCRWYPRLYSMDRNTGPSHQPRHSAHLWFAEVETIEEATTTRILTRLQHSCFGLLSTTSKGRGTLSPSITLSLRRCLPPSTPKDRSTGNEVYLSLCRLTLARPIPAKNLYTPHMVTNPPPDFLPFFGRTPPAPIPSSRASKLPISACQRSRLTRLPASPRWRFGWLFD